VTDASFKKPIRIAIVEDDPVLRKLLVSTLQADADYAVVAEFGEGKAAVAAIPHLAPDIVLVDLGLPDMSGIDVIRQLKAMNAAGNVMVVTTFGDERTITAALEAGADGYLLKGVALEELRRDVHFSAKRRIAAVADDRAQAVEPSSVQGFRAKAGQWRRQRPHQARARNTGNDRQGFFLRGNVENLRHLGCDGA
jgi:DNA-binding NarL/FixJ family response regulator